MVQYDLYRITVHKHLVTQIKFKSDNRQFLLSRINKSSDFAAECRSAIPPLWPTFLYGFFLLGLMGYVNVNWWLNLAILLEKK